MIRRFVNNEYLNSFFVFGARGTGKSTYVNGQFLHDKKIKPQDVHYIDLLDSENENRYRKNPEIIENLPVHIKWVIIDDVQKIPQLMDHVHRLIEKKNIILFY